MKIRGVTWYKAIKKWQARISVRGKLHHLGYFDDIRDAEIARLTAEKKFWKEEK